MNLSEGYKVSVSPVDSSTTVSLLKQFEEEIRELTTEERVVEYVQRHRLEFLPMGEAIKIRKKAQKSPLGEGIRSDHLSHSLILLHRFLFRADNLRIQEGATLLGSGAFKRVYAVEILGSDRRMAVAVSDDAEMLKNEFETTQTVRSPYVLPILAYGSRKDAHKSAPTYAIMELCTASLEQKLKDDPLYLRNHPELLEQFESALVACHAAGVLHNDAWPRNLLIRMDGTLALTDFGNASQVHANLLDKRSSWLSWAWHQVLMNKDEGALNELQGAYETANLSHLQALLLRVSWIFDRSTFRHWLFASPSISLDLWKEAVWWGQELWKSKGTAFAMPEISLSDVEEATGELCRVLC